MRDQRINSAAPTHLAQPPATSPVRRTFLRASEVAMLFDVSPKTVARWAKEGRLPFQRTLGGHRRYPEPETRALADSMVVPRS